MFLFMPIEEAIQITRMKALLYSKDKRTLSMVEENELLLFGSWDALKVAPQHGLKLWLKTMRYSHGEANSKSFMNVKTQERVMLCVLCICRSSMSFTFHDFGMTKLFLEYSTAMG
ncbi:hypothetical protein MTR67_001631 [Solanum verrucosum]|uniref:Uncharacterized protein n=1 Tax=Solanum verrucosum TaxID=315347 RepID=A0AAF0PT47_SOLVR|nr:hypothetical protein MTR67_001631 [Solanum verrucosum]